MKDRSLRMQKLLQLRDVNVGNGLAERSASTAVSPAAWPIIMYCGSIRNEE
jgi:hypothetical protein